VVKMVYSKRFEKKYIIDFQTYEKIKKDLKPYFTTDKYGDKNGLYIVSSLYYDSSDFKFYREKIDGEKQRSKLRLRTYKDFNNQSLMPKDKVFLEIKKRDNLNVSKKKVLMNEQEAKKFIERPILNKELFDKCDKSEKYALTEAVYLKTLYDIRPTVIVTYTRQAFVNKFGPKVRITFDKNIKYREHNLNVHDISCRNYSADPRLIIMEIKYNEILPIWISELIRRHSLFLSTFGKYCVSVGKIMEKREELINKINY